MTGDELVSGMTRSEREDFAERFLKSFLGGGFGAMSKREVETLVFHCLEQTKRFSSLSFYERANALRVLESRVKSLRADATQRYSQLDHRSAIRELALGVTENGKIVATFDDDRITLSIEDPALRRELEHALRSNGGRLDYTLNRDVVTVRVAPFLELLKRTLAFGDDALAERLASGVKDSQAAKRLLDSKFPLAERVSKFLAEKKGTASAIGSLLSGIAKVATLGTP